MQRTLAGILMGIGVLITSCTPAYVPSMTRGEIQQEQARLAARSEAYYQEQLARVERVGERLLAHIPNRPSITFSVMRGTDSVNASVTSSGQVRVTWGMLQFVRSDDELAAVLGHEIAHVTQGHAAKKAMGQVLVGVLAIASELAVQGTGQAVGQLGQGFVNHYNQGQELEADVVGLQYAAAAGYDPQVGVALWERWAVELPQTLTADFFASHPSSPERTVAARKVAAELVAQGAVSSSYSEDEPSPVLERSASAAQPVNLHVHWPTAQASTSAPLSSSGQTNPHVRWPVVQANTSVDTQLRTLEADFHAGRISLEECRAQKKALLNQP